ncbi:MAG: capsular biosynthesis protein, partial [Nitrosopumilales archaeon CG_4_9_14_0_8_um_filter_34_10]
MPAFPPESRIAPKRKQNVMIAGILGLFIGIL